MMEEVKGEESNGEFEMVSNDTEQKATEVVSGEKLATDVSDTGNYNYNYLLYYIYIFIFTSIIIYFL